MSITQLPHVKSLARQQYQDNLNDYFKYLHEFRRERQPEDYEAALFHATLAELAQKYLLRAEVVVSTMLNLDQEMR